MNIFEFPAGAHILTKKYAHSIREKMQIYRTLERDDRECKSKLLIEEKLFSEKLDICPLSAARIMEEFNSYQSCKRKIVVKH